MNTFGHSSFNPSQSSMQMNINQFYTSSMDEIESKINVSKHSNSNPSPIPNIKDRNRGGTVTVTVTGDEQESIPEDFDPFQSTSMSMVFSSSDTAAGLFQDTDAFASPSSSTPTGKSIHIDTRDRDHDFGFNHINMPKSMGIEMQKQMQLRNGITPGNRTATTATTSSSTPQGFDNGHFQFNGLMMDDSTVGTALSQRHLLKSQSGARTRSGTSTHARSSVDSVSGASSSTPTPSSQVKKLTSPLKTLIRSASPRKSRPWSTKGKSKGIGSARSSRSGGKSFEQQQQGQGAHLHSNSNRKGKSKRSEKMELKMYQNIGSQKDDVDNFSQKDGFSRPTIAQDQFMEEEPFDFQRFPNSKNSSSQSGKSKPQKQHQPAGKYNLCHEPVVFDEVGDGWTDSQLYKAGAGSKSMEAGMSSSMSSGFISSPEQTFDSSSKHLDIRAQASIGTPNMSRNMASIAEGEGNLSTPQDEMSRSEQNSDHFELDTIQETDSSRNLSTRSRSRFHESTSHDEMSPIIVRRKGRLNKKQPPPSSLSRSLRSSRLPPLPKPPPKSNDETEKQLSASPKTCAKAVKNHKIGLVPHDEMSPLVPKKTLQEDTSSSSNQFVSVTKKLDLLSRSMKSQPEPEPVESFETFEANPPSFTPITPQKKASPKMRGGPFLDSSWQQSPIKPAGSFAIFDDSQLDETEPIINGEDQVRVTNISVAKSELDENEPIISGEDQDRANTSIAKSFSRSDVQQPEFMNVVAAIVIQTFFRRHLAYKLTCERYIAVLKIQRFARAALERKQNKSAVLQQSTHEYYDIAATKIQAVWRGWWVRDCLNVEAYCASTIQRNFRSYWARINYKFDLYRVILAQSVARKYIVRSRLHREKKAATAIQSQWRVLMAKGKVMHTLADILIVQSVCRRFLVQKRMTQIRLSSRLIHARQPMRETLSTHMAPQRRRSIVRGAPISHSEKTLKTGTAKPKPQHRGQKEGVMNMTMENLNQRNGELSQMQPDELIRKWQLRRGSRPKNRQFAEF